MAATRAQAVRFGSFVLDRERGTLMRGNERIGLRPKAWTLLCALIDRGDRLVTKEELIDTVWPGAAVHEWALSNAIAELRAALGDDSRHPQFIAVVHRRGYRWIAAIAAGTETLAGAPSDAPIAVGREKEIEQIRQMLEGVRRGRRQLLLITGEAGIGKTTLIDALLAGVEGNLLVGRGQSVEQQAAGEPYLPVFEALSQLCRGRDGSRVIEALRQYAPLWLAQMPSFLTEADLSHVQGHTMGAVRERMLREIGEALEVLAAQEPLAIVLEDLHWSDHATIDLVAYLSRRRGPAHLLVVATYRPTSLLVGSHPLRHVRRELEGNSSVREIAVPFLSEGSVEAYLAARFAGHQFPADLAAIVHQKTDGNPLFMVTVVDSFLNEGWIQAIDGHWQWTTTLDIARTSIPDSLKLMIEHRIDDLPQEAVGLLQIASLVGMEFPSPILAAAAGLAQEEVEEQCDTLARRHQMVASVGAYEQPDGTVGTRYVFRHALYRRALAERVGPARRRRLHEAIARYVEAAWKHATAEVCAELALHYDLAGNVRGAAQYLRELAIRAVQRGALGDARTAIERALAILPPPSMPEEIEDRIELIWILASVAQASYGHPSPQFAQYLNEAAALTERVDRPLQRLRVLLGMYGHAYFLVDLRRCAELTAEMQAIDARLGASPLSMAVRTVPAGHLHATGQLEAARALLEEALTFEAPALPFARPAVKVIATTLLSRVYTLMGFIDQGQQMEDTGLQIARDNSPFDTNHALGLRASRAAMIGDTALARAASIEGIELIDLYGSVTTRPFFEAVLGWSLAVAGHADDGIAAIRGAMATRRRAGMEGALNGVGWVLALALIESGDPGVAAEIDAVIAWSESHGDVWTLADVYRLRGECWRLQPGKEAEAERCFEHAIRIARTQAAKWWELRASLSLARLYADQGRAAQGRAQLRRVYDWFREGVSTPDLQAARSILDAP